MARRQQTLIIAAVATVGLLILVLAGLLIWRLLGGSQVAPAGPTPTALEPAGPTESVETTATPSPVAPATPARQSNTSTFVQAVGRLPVSFNPVFATDDAAQHAIDLLLPRLLGQEPTSGVITPTGLASSWTISPDGRTYRFALVNNLSWSDGRPVTSADFAFTYAALADPAVGSPYRDRTTNLLRVETPDPATVVVTLSRAECSVLNSLRRPLLPAHLFAPDFSDLATHSFNQTPSVSAGPYTFAERLGDDRIILAANPAYPPGAPAIARYELRAIPEPGVRSQALALGQVDLAHFPPDELRLTELPAGPDTAIYPANTDGYHFLALNLADPANPQPGRTDSGERLAQTPHPILGDVAVRQAIAAAIDYDTLIADLFAGHAYRPATYVPPTATWAAAGLSPAAYDPPQAMQRLQDAGWTDPDGDGVRSRAGLPLRLVLRTNADNPLRVRLSEFVAAQLRPVGFEIVVDPVGFDELTDSLLGQRYDLVVIGWENLGADPGNSPFWHSRDDVPGAGFNFTSFQDAGVDSLLDSARQNPTCDLNQRAEAYRQVQDIVRTASPYVLLAGDVAAWAYATRWQGIAPGPWRFDHNIAQWRLP